MGVHISPHFFPKLETTNKVSTVRTATNCCCTAATESIESTNPSLRSVNCLLLLIFVVLWLFSCTGVILYITAVHTPCRCRAHHTQQVCARKHVEPMHTCANLSLYGPQHSSRTAQLRLSHESLDLAPQQQRRDLGSAGKIPSPPPCLRRPLQTTRTRRFLAAVIVVSQLSPPTREARSSPRLPTGRCTGLGWC